MTRKRLLGLGAGLLLTIAAALPAGAAAWAPAGSAAIKPGNQTFTEGAQCTSNFIFEDGSNTTSARRPIARAPGRRPTRTAATAARCRSARRSR